MRYMMMVKAGSNYETGAPPDARLIAAIGKHAEEMTRAGVLLETGGLLPSSQGARVRAAGGKLTVTDGPFIESKELIGVHSRLCEEIFSTATRAWFAPQRPPCHRPAPRSRRGRARSHHSA